MGKLIHGLFTLILILIFFQSKAQVSIGAIDPGPYTPGSTIAATFVLGTDCIGKTNTFELYLSDATGNFTNEILIGSYTGFYSTFVNGVIPATTPPGSGYKVRIRSTSNGIYSTPANAFEIKAGPAVTAKVTALAIDPSNPETFGYCANRNNAPVSLTNQSTATGTVTAAVTNELDGGPVTQINFDGTIKTFTPGAAHYMMLVKVVMPDGSIATKAYFIINNLVNTAFSTTGAGLVCLPLGELIYGVDYEAIQKNFPGNLYRITWGDDTEDLYTLCDLKQNGNNVKHNYTRSSCGSTFNGKHNVFGINIGTESPFCGPVGQSLSTFAKVVTVTENRFTGPEVACANADVTFANTSMPGQNQDDNAVDCIDHSVTYNWYVNGQIILPNVPKSTPFVYKFPAPGNYEVKLGSASSGNCQGDVFTKTICVQAPPVPAFTLSSNLICLTTGTVTANSSASVLNNTCSATPVYTWIVTPSTGVMFTQGKANPEFKFTQPGIYNITLTIKSIMSTPASCEETTASQSVVVNGEPQATLSPDKNLCAKGAYTFDPDAVDTKTIISGNAEDLPDTYTWEVTGGRRTFVAPTTSHSKYPKINFEDFAPYTVKLTYTNNCGEITRMQQITFKEAPVPTLTAPDQVCFDAPINLQGAITNNTGTTFTWSSSGDGTFSPADALTTVYTPTSAEQNSGTTTIKLLVRTGLSGDCAEVPVTKTITILPRNAGTNDTRQICTGSTVNYTPVSTIAGSIFTWTAVNPDGRATGFSPTGAGSVNETITNTNARANAIVVYTVTPSSNGCQGVPFTFTVTITPKPVITAVPAPAAICSNQPAGIILSSNLGNTKYSWTSIATTGVTGNTNQSAAVAATAINEVLRNNGTTQGSVIYTITPISDTGCPGTSVTATVLVNPALTVAAAGEDEQLCETPTYTLNGNVPVVGNGKWILTSGQLTVRFDDETNPKATVTGLVAGQTYNFKWTISAPGACLPSSDDVNITVTVPTVPGTTATGNPTTVCESANSGIITLTGHTGTVLRWESSIDEGTTWIPIINTTATLTYTNIVTTTQYRAVVQNGTCEIRNSTATTIAVTPATTIAKAGPDQILCDETSVQLQADPTLKAGETAGWSVAPGSPNVTIADPSNPAAQVTGLTPGQTYRFRWTITGPSACGPTSDEVTITDHLPITNSISSTSTEVCSGKVIRITGSTPSGGDGINYAYTWESSTDGISWILIDGQTAKDLSYTLTNTLNFRRTVISGTCTQVSNTLRIIAQPPITGNTITADQSICTGIVPAPLAGSIPTGSDGHFNYQWQSSEDNGNTWADISSARFSGYSPPVLTTTTRYRRVVSTITCNGDQKNISVPVTITVKPNAKAEFTFSTDKACTPFVIDANNVKTIPYPDRNSTYTWYADGAPIGTGMIFPGYTISASDQSVTIKLVTTPSQGCQPDEFSHIFSTVQSVAPSYTQSTTEGCGPLTVNFTNTSTSLTNATFRWDFGNGTISSQTIPAPVTFQPDPTGKDTTYTVTLTAATSCGSSSFTSTVFVKAKPVSIFSPDKTVGCSPMTVVFSNTSPGGTNTYYYDFGDGTFLTKTDKSPVNHTFITNVTKDFVVKMISENECGRDESSYTIRVSPNTVLPELVVNAEEKQGCAPFKVNFHNNSRGANLFKYDFGDGATLLTRSAPEVVAHTFTTPGTYTITLTASNGCSDTTTTESVTVLEQPLVAFNADLTLGCPGLPVQFRNTSTGGQSYLWDFGDGTTANEFEPKHTFTGDQEYYTISLQATNSLGCTNTTIRNQYIHIVPPPVAQFNVAPSTQISVPNYTFRFEDESTNSPAIWTWDFGDGTSSALPDPSHTYPDTGKYQVTLKVMNSQGCFSTTFKTVMITGVPGYLYVPNSFMPGSGTQELSAFKAKGSGIASWRMSIFNKWGQVIWETTRLEEGRPVEGWDGTYRSSPVQQGIYYWKIDVLMINGIPWKGMSYNGSSPKRTGTINLIR